VLGGHSIAEAGKRHVALGSRRIAGRHLGLALLGLGRESMSEAGPPAAKLGYQWRPMRSPFGRELGRRRWDLLVEGASGSTICTLWLGCGEAGPGSRGGARDAGHKQRAATRGVCEPDHRARAGPTTPTRVAARDTAHPCRGDGLVAAGRRSTNCVADPRLGRQQWQSSVAEGGLGLRAGLPPRRKHEENHGGRKGESPRLGNGVTPRVLVTTSRLQRLVRGISLMGRMPRRWRCSPMG
jgi:hypothetical protein